MFGFCTEFSFSEVADGGVSVTFISGVFFASMYGKASRRKLSCEKYLPQTYFTAAAADFTATLPLDYGIFTTAEESALF